MSFEKLLNGITPETFERLKMAVETGRWPDGVTLTEAQKENSMRLVIAWQAKFRPSEEVFAVGQDGNLVTRPKAQQQAEIRQKFGQSATIAKFPLEDEK